MDLPRNIKLLGHTIKVSSRDDLYIDCDCIGRWTREDLLIEIDTKSAPSLQLHTLWHEITHAVLDLTGYPELSKDETFVDTLGGALAQVVSSIHK